MLAYFCNNRSPVKSSCWQSWWADLQRLMAASTPPWWW
jgi:hypothetical protein